jgi:S-adenosylmethionine-diacylglycerol 3-amino-3-carboxypropyl transferase
MSENLKAGSGTEVAERADFSAVRYAQVWEDADILVKGLGIQEGEVCLSIASAGDNALALLTKNPSRVIALDLNPSQLACLELRVAAYKELSHPELLKFMGSEPCEDRIALYHRCRKHLSPAVRAFWDARPNQISMGIGSLGKFENYFALFRNKVLPLVHSKSLLRDLLRSRSATERSQFYESRWNTWRWRLLFKLFFSRTVMGKLGRDPSFFKYVKGSVAERILTRARYALTELDPSMNPYLQWIMTGRHVSALPLALRAEHFDTIRGKLHKLDWRCQTVEAFVATYKGPPVMRFNLSDIFEYMSEESYEAVLRQLLSISAPGARMAYWNMLAPRSRPESLATQLLPLKEEAERLFKEDKAFFYSAFILEEIR